ncbi:hypothetical protein N185_16810 [Sinorhizobium sp. GW3]|nr:hypothetical protein N185_16810 [Sinorhizobium sp. GW3]
MHVEWRAIKHALESMPVSATIIQHAVGIFSLLADAEARVHGTTPNDVAFHEVGAWDSIADILAAAYLVDAVGSAQWTVGPVPLGSGRVRTDHGLLPVPAPATVLLLKGFTMIDDGIAGERVTPTGAAILRYLCGSSSRHVNSGQFSGAGYGFGERRFPGLSNCLRVLAFEQSPSIENDMIAVLECEIDDQTGEDLAIALSHIRDHPHVLDALQAAAFGKKGRILTHLRVLAAPQGLDEVAQLIFDETTTIGIRQTLTRRITVPRKLHEVEINGCSMKAKTSTRPSGQTVKLEADGFLSVKGHAARENLRHNVGRAPQ